MTNLRICVVFVALVVSTPAFGDARISKIPQSITQTYGHGDFSKLECPLGFVDKKDPVCRFTLKEGRKRVVSTFDLASAGYVLMTQQYQVFGTLENGDIELSLVVDCNEEDQRHAGGAESAECRLFFTLKDGELIPEKTVVTYEVEGKVKQVLRQIESRSN